MPPRTTQKSNRPRVSDRTMVGKLPTLLTGAQKPNGRSNANQNLLWIRKAKPRSGTNFRSCTQGAGCQKNASPQNTGKVFSLDIPFYRTRPSHRPDDLHPVPFVEPASRFVLSTHGQVQGSTGRHDNLSTEFLEDSATRTAELIRVHDLMEHDCASRHFNVADPCALLVLLVGDDHAVFVNTLSREDSPQQCILPNVGNTSQWARKWAKISFSSSAVAWRMRFQSIALAG